MENLAILGQIIIAISIIVVWVARFDNIVVEFKQYGLSDIVRSCVGAAKISLATLLIAGIWYPALVPVPALLMAFLMLGAQGAHQKVGSTWQKRLPSFVLLIISLAVAAISAGLI